MICNQLQLWLFYNYITKDHFLVASFYSVARFQCNTQLVTHLILYMCQIILDRSTAELNTRFCALSSVSCEPCIWKLAMRQAMWISFDIHGIVVGVIWPLEAMPVWLRYFRQGAAHDVCRWSDEKHTGERFDLISSRERVLAFVTYYIFSKAVRFTTVTWLWEWSSFFCISLLVNANHLMLNWWLTLRHVTWPKYFGSTTEHEVGDPESVLVMHKITHGAPCQYLLIDIFE